MAEKDPSEYLIGLSETLMPLASKDFRKLSAAEQVFVLVWEVDSEVNNGGFNQYFFNSAGDHATETPAALRLIGANRTAAIVDRAIALFPNNQVPAASKRRQGALEEIDPETEIFEELDEEFYQRPDELTTLLYSFVRENRAEIRGTT